MCPHGASHPVGSAGHVVLQRVEGYMVTIVQKPEHEKYSQSNSIIFGVQDAILSHTSLAYGLLLLTL